MNNLKMTELKTIAQEKGIKFNPIGLKKVELIEMIEAHDAEMTAIKKVKEPGKLDRLEDELDIHYHTEDLMEIVNDEELSKSEKIRRLHTEHNVAKSNIAKLIEVRYQMVNNVLNKMK